MSDKKVNPLIAGGPDVPPRDIAAELGLDKAKTHDELMEMAKKSKPAPTAEPEPDKPKPKPNKN